MRLLAIGAVVAVCGLLAVPLAGAAATDTATCELRDVTQTEGTDISLGEPDPGQPITPGIGGTSFDFILACQVPAGVRFELDVIPEDGTAVRGDDWTIPSNHIVTGPFATPVSSEIPITAGVLADPYVEPDEAFTLRLTTDDATVELTKATALGTIVNDDDGAPCLLLSDTAVAVSGPPSTHSQRGFADIQRITVANCGGTDVNLLARGTNATGGGATWELTNASSGGAVDSTCELELDTFRTNLTLWNTQGGGVGTPLTPQDRTLVGLDGISPFVFGSVTGQEFSADVELPCEGSSGIGQPMTMDVVLTAVTP